MAASDAATSGFGIKINQLSDINMSDDLSVWLSNVNSMLGPARIGRTSSHNPSSDRNDNDNSGPNHTTNHDDSVMAQILQSQQQITDHLAQSNETSIFSTAPACAFHHQKR